MCSFISRAQLYCSILSTTPFCNLNCQHVLEVWNVLIIVTQFESPILPSLLYLSLQRLLLFNGSIRQNSPTKVHLSLNVLLTQAMIDDIEESLSSHRIIQRLGQFCFSLLTLLEKGEVDEWKIRIIESLFRCTDRSKCLGLRTTDRWHVGSLNLFDCFKGREVNVRVCCLWLLTGLRYIPLSHKARSPRGPAAGDRREEWLCRPLWPRPTERPGPVLLRIPTVRHWARPRRGTRSKIYDARGFGVASTGEPLTAYRGGRRSSRTKHCTVKSILAAFQTLYPLPPPSLTRAAVHRLLLLDHVN